MTQSTEYKPETIKMTRNVLTMGSTAPDSDRAKVMRDVIRRAGKPVRQA